MDKKILMPENNTEQKKVENAKYWSCLMFNIHMLNYLPFNNN